MSRHIDGGPDGTKRVRTGPDGARWPWWRITCGAALPWLVAIIVAVAGGPAWAAVGFGIDAFVVAMVGAAVSDAIRAAGRTS